MVLYRWSILTWDERDMKMSTQEHGDFLEFFNKLTPEKKEVFLNELEDFDKTIETSLRYVNEIEETPEVIELADYFNREVYGKKIPKNSGKTKLTTGVLLGIELGLWLSYRIETAEKQGKKYTSEDWKEYLKCARPWELWDLKNFIMVL